MSIMGDKKSSKSKPSRRYSEASTGEVSWADVLPETLSDLIHAVTATGCAIRFGYSRDKGAYAIGILGDGEPYTVWAHGSEQLDIKIVGLMAAFQKSSKD